MAILRHLGCLLLGVAVALGTVAVHRSVFPLGLLLGLGATFAVVGWLLRFGDRRLTASYAAGWLAVFVLLLLGRPEGDYVLAADLDGYTLIAGAFVMVAVGVVSLAGGRRPSA